MSSTTPSDEPRWPPVTATVSMIVSRISRASWASCDLVESAQVGGPGEFGRIGTVAGLLGWRTGRVSVGV